MPHLRRSRRRPFTSMNPSCHGQVMLLLPNQPYDYQHRSSSLGIGEDNRMVDQWTSRESTRGSGALQSPTAVAIATPRSIGRRLGKACRNCRKKRAKCVQSNGNNLPCKRCEEQGPDVASQCEFTPWGERDKDRHHRNPRPLGIPKPVDARSPIGELAFFFPPTEEILDAVQRFTRQYFQLGFIHKQSFLGNLKVAIYSIDSFLLSSVLSISARLSPRLSQRFGTGLKASEHFMEAARSMASEDVRKHASLERCQAFYLLSVAQQGSGWRKASNWMLHSQDNLHAGRSDTAKLAANEITTLLPCEEVDFAAGRNPVARAALTDTLPAKTRPELESHPNRSLFASLMQIHHFWGIIWRQATTFGFKLGPQKVENDSAEMIEKLRQWEDSLPMDHRWNSAILRRHRKEGHHLGYLGVTMMSRLCNIVVRRPQLENLLSMDQKSGNDREHLVGQADQLFANVRDLFDQIQAQFSDRLPGEGVGAQMVSFCVYSCGLLAVYLCKFPHICSNESVSKTGPKMLHRTVEILKECKETWPLASGWLDSLSERSRSVEPANDVPEGSMSDERESSPAFGDVASSPTDMRATTAIQDSALASITHPSPTNSVDQQLSSAAASTPSSSNGSFSDTVDETVPADDSPSTIESETSPHLLSYQYHLPQVHGNKDMPTVDGELPHDDANASIPFHNSLELDTLLPQRSAEDLHLPSAFPHRNVATVTADGFSSDTTQYDLMGLAPATDGFEDELRNFIVSESGETCPDIWT